ncbi:MmgE/PrpD family protein [Chloroflexota bacterium]
MEKIVDAINPMVKTIVQTRYEDIPEKDREVSKKCVIDTLGVLLAGSPSSGCKAIVDYVKDQGGHEESTIMVYGGKAPAPYAALANGTMARALDFGDAHEPAYTPHLSETTVPTAFAIAERQGKVDGKELIAAITLGNDMIARLSLAKNISKVFMGKSPTFTFGVFGSAAVAGKILGFDEERMVNALGLAYGQATGNMQCYEDSSLAIRVSQGLVSRNGLCSTLLAERGITAARNILEGVAGYYPVYEQGQYVREELVSELGERFEGSRVSVKPYPTCKGTHATIEATLQLVREYDIKPNDVIEVIVRTAQQYPMFFAPERYRPGTMVDAQFSIPWPVATAIVKRRFSIEDLSDEALRDEVVLNVASKVRYVVDEKMAETSTGMVLGESIVDIITEDGKTYSKRIDFVRGHFKNPMSTEEVIEKFRSCVPFAARPLPERNVDAAVDMLQNLEQVDDVVKIVHLLS